jgi:hypothetical protein
MDVIIGILFGALLTFIIIKFFYNSSKREVTEKQSVVLVEKIKSVCKLVSVEGDFSEIYDYKSVKTLFMNLIESKKKAIVKVNAKAMIGYDLSKVTILPNTNSKTITITHFPKAEILSMDANIEYYDKTENLFNKFTSEDLTTINKEAKQVIVDKIPESGLLETANKEVLEAIGIIKSIVETVGWKLDMSKLELPEESKKLSE